MATFNNWYSQAITISIVLMVLYSLDAQASSPKTNVSSRDNTTKNGNEIKWKRKSVRNSSVPTSRARANCMSTGSVCNTYHGSWSHFYLKIGGWLMLGIVLVGISCLAITHYLGMKKVNKERRCSKKRFTQLSWTDAKTKSKLAKLMG